VDECDREEEETRRQVYGNAEARRIVDALAARWDQFTDLSPEEHLGAVYDAVLMRVDARLGDGTPRGQIAALAEGFFRDEVKRLER
jgi:hypothetical protein